MVDERVGQWVAAWVASLVASSVVARVCPMGASKVVQWVAC